MSQLPMDVDQLTRVFGPSCDIAYAVWTPQAIAGDQVLTSAHGIESIQRVSAAAAGRWNVQLKQKGQALQAWFTPVENATTHYRIAIIESKTPSTGQLVVAHRRATWASITSAPSASDAVDELHLVVLIRRGV